MKKRIMFLSVVGLGVVLSGCSTMEQTSKQVGQLTETVRSKISQLFEDKETVDETIEEASRAIEERKEKLKSEQVPASLKNMLIQLESDGYDDYGRVFYKLVITNVADTKITVDSHLFNLNQYSTGSPIDIDFPSEQKDKKVIEPGDTFVLKRALGPVSPDAPGYYYLTASYHGKSFWTQEPFMEDFR